MNRFCNCLRPSAARVVVLAGLAAASAGTIRPAAAQTPDSAAAELHEPSGTITLRDALAMALRGSPQLVGTQWEIRAREAEVAQASVRPNPALTTDVENVAGTGALEGTSAAEITLRVEQDLQLGGQRGKRRQAAERSTDVARAERKIREAEVTVEVARAFFEVAAIQARIALADELARVSGAFVETVERRMHAGGASPVELSRARVEAESSRLNSAQRRRELNVARARLAATWGSRRPVFSEIAAELDSLHALPPLDELRALVAAGPELGWWHAETERRRALERTERALGIPAITAGAGIRRLEEPGESAFVFGLGVPLPLFDRNQGAARAAELRVLGAQAESDAAQLQIETALAAAYERAEAAHDEAVALRDRILPEAEAAFANQSEAYRLGSARLTDVLDTERTLFELRDRHVDSLARHHTATADLERLLGRSLDDVHGTGGGR
jgi:cobalt-zinc-cadmium efflux system outer membrane protein